MRTSNNSMSSINTINHCRRKYYYKYIAKIPEKKNIDALVGIIVHKTIKERINNQKLKNEDIYHETWNQFVLVFNELKLDINEINKYKDECWRMFLNWINDYDDKTKINAEVKLESKKYQLIGFIDEVLEKDEKIGIIENKTSKKDEITLEIELQIGIYSLLFLEYYGKLPDFAAVRFLRTGNKKFVQINERLLNKARYEAKAIKLKILSNKIEDYSKKPSNLCKWSTGECSFFDICKPFSY